MKVILFGTGKHYDEYKIFFCNDEIICLLDNDNTMQGRQKDGFEILSPADGVRLTYDAIFVLSTYKREITNQLLNLGVRQEYIYQEEDIYKHCGAEWRDKSVEHYGSTKSLEEIITGNIIALTDDLEITGAVVALQNLLCCWREQGEFCVIASPVDGPMREEFLKHGIDVIIAPAIRILPLDELYWLDKSRFILLNTVFMYKSLLSHKKYSSIMWWLHDSEMLYQGINNEVLQDIDWKNVFIYAVSDIAALPMVNRIGAINVGRFTYGLKDVAKFEANTYIDVKKDKLVFAMIGSVTKVKGVDVFLAAINEMDKSITDSCEFWIVGGHETAFGREICNEAEHISSVRVFSVMGRDEIIKIYQRIDVLVCPSRDDSLPVVASESMMFSHPCIVSDRTGTATFIKPQVNGLICEAGNSKSLVNCIEWMFNNRKWLPQMGEAARRTFENIFSLKVLSVNANYILQECTKLSKK